MIFFAEVPGLLPKSNGCGLSPSWFSIKIEEKAVFGNKKNNISFTTSICLLLTCRKYGNTANVLIFKWKL